MITGLIRKALDEVARELPTWRHPQQGLHPPRVAAAIFDGRAFEYNHLRAILQRGQCGCQSGSAAARDNNIAVEFADPNPPVGDR